LSEAPFPELSVVILAYDEEANVASVVDETVSFLGEAVADWEVIVVDDGSSDGTAGVCERLAADEARIRVLRHPVNRGMGGGLQTAYAAATKVWVTFLPADGQIDPRGFSAYFPRTADADLVTGRYESRGDGPLRWVLSRGLRTLVWLLTSSRVLNEAPYLFRRSLWAEHPCASESFFLNLEFVIRCERAGTRIATVMNRVRPRLSGASKVASLARIRMVFGELLRMRLGGLPPKRTRRDA
jgi:glycosyltransferase involved in cell wall biosynthesis